MVLMSGMFIRGRIQDTDNLRPLTVTKKKTFLRNTESLGNDLKNGVLPMTRHFQMFRGNANTYT